MGELMIDCGRCRLEFAVTADRVRATEVEKGELEKAIGSLFGVKAMDKRTEYRIYCPRCGKAIAKFVSPILGI